ncbi:MAG: efflux RND transporter periplasmic adaptor subunit, partial [Gammaproteobacteria bacterium]|nr:efflux RND transporter periplasmic adaptor subunit [Gammaproteobacteria bacterium]
VMARLLSPRATAIRRILARMSSTPDTRFIPRFRRRLATLLAVLSALPFCLAAESLPIVTQRLGDVTETPVYSAPATVVAHHTPRIAAEIDARIVDLPVAVGDRVDVGTPLAQLDCARAEAALAVARGEVERSAAQQRFAAAQLERARDLTRSKSISEELLDQRRSELAAARADQVVRTEQVRLAEIDVDRCVLRSPIAGVVTRRHASIGDYATRGSPVVDLVESVGQEVSVALRDEQTATLRQAQNMRFTSNGAEYAVELRALLPQVDSTTRTREARLRFVDAVADPGTAGRLVWQGQGRLLPAIYLVRRNGVLGVFVRQQDTARFVALPDAQDGRPAAITLAADTLLIDDGRQRLNDGDAVRSVDTE